MGGTFVERNNKIGFFGFLDTFQIQTTSKNVFEVPLIWKAILVPLN